jgi:hypothetical protein
MESKQLPVLFQVLAFDYQNYYTLHERLVDAAYSIQDSKTLFDKYE